MQRVLRAGRGAALLGLARHFLLMLGAREGELAAWSSHAWAGWSCARVAPALLPAVLPVLAAELSCRGTGVGTGTQLPRTKCPQRSGGVLRAMLSSQLQLLQTLQLRGRARILGDLNPRGSNTWTSEDPRACLLSPSSTANLQYVLFSKLSV